MRTFMVMLFIVSCSISCFVKPKSNEPIHKNVNDLPIPDSTSFASEQIVEMDTNAVGVIGQYQVSVSFQNKIITLDEQQYSVWSLLQQVYGQDGDSDTNAASPANTLSGIEVHQKQFSNSQGGCSQRVVIALKRTNDFSDYSFDVIFIEHEGSNLITNIETFVTYRDKIQEEYIKILTPKTLTEGCETLIIEHFKRGEDSNDKWHTRTVTFYLAQEHSFNNVLQFDTEDVTEFYGDQPQKKFEATCSFEILSKKTNGLFDIKVDCKTDREVFTKTHRYNGQFYLDH